jgi:hypothetical protein
VVIWINADMGALLKSEVIHHFRFLPRPVTEKKDS